MSVPLQIIGVMTGNSMDAVDCVLTRFEESGHMTDLAFFSEPIPAWLFEALSEMRNAVKQMDGNMQHVTKEFDFRHDNSTMGFEDILQPYINCCAQAIEKLIEKSGINRDEIDLIGFHGQTLGHLPPSIANSKKPENVYTIQIGDGQMLANLTDLPVAFDFRSDDMMSGGEGAPLAPKHHEALSHQLKNDALFPIAFCNAGNTGNFSLITRNTNGELAALGWDTGPFNAFPNALMRKEKGEACDQDGKIGQSGKVDLNLLRLLFENSVITRENKNFLTLNPPKSSDSQWYRFLPEMMQGNLPFADRLRTAEYFSAYAYAHSLTLTPDDLELPKYFALCGGGWQNPVCRTHFEALLNGDEATSPILPEHKEPFTTLRARLPDSIEISTSDTCTAIDGQAMEARLIAHAAWCRVMGQPFTTPATTGCKEPTICGILRFPEGTPPPKLLELLNKAPQTYDYAGIDTRFSRASAGWYTRKATRAA